MTCDGLPGPPCRGKAEGKKATQIRTRKDSGASIPPPPPKAIVLILLNKRPHQTIRNRPR